MNKTQKTHYWYELIQDYKDPNGIIPAGTIKTVDQWMTRFALLNYNDCAEKTDWFRPIEVRLYNESDLMDFANYLLDRPLVSYLSCKSELLLHLKNWITERQKI